MSDLFYYLRYNTVAGEDWWLFRIVAWYCRSRRIDLPAGRCHFSEIICLYVPIYVALGLLFKLIVGVIWPLLRFVTRPLWMPVLWYLRRLDEEFSHRAIRSLTLATVAVLGLLFYTGVSIGLDLRDGSLSDEGDDASAMEVALVVLAFFGFLTAEYILVWIYDAVRPRLQPAFELGHEASEALHRPTVRQVGGVVVSPFKIVPAGARFGRDFGAVTFSTVRGGWRRTVCPRLTYRFDTSKYRQQ
ncbi:MAG: hypothetical protein Q8P13_01615 [bacterium]|nr:hypothetical protein [bacterium]